MPHHLILVPTDRERRVISPRLAGGLGPGHRVELCGFGMVAAAARTSLLIAASGPSRVILVGIAGSLDERIPVGEARRFDSVACHGIGAGSGADFVPAAVMGWRQWPGDPPDPATAIGDVLPCGPPGTASGHTGNLLLTVASAAGCPTEVALRRRLHPEAAAEDMEGFAVAVACRLHGVQLDIVRGISNSAGHRDPACWRTDEALEAAAEIVLQLIAEGP